jgi:hypothetical protein
MVPAVTETETSLTPGMRRTAVSILLAQEAQSMPSTLKRVSVPSDIGKSSFVSMRFYDL